MNEQKTISIAAFAVMTLFFLGAWLTAPTEEDVQKCTKATNYTAERCEWEMTR